MKTARIVLLIFVMGLFLINVAKGQELSDTTKLYKIETADGNEYVGYIIQKNSELIKIKTANLGELTIKQKDVASLKTIGKDSLHEGVFSYSDLHSSRYFTTSNGYGLRKGNGYYQNMWIFYNQFGYGFTNNFSISAGIVPLFLFAGASSPVWITPKISIPLKKDKINLGAGLLVASVMGEKTEAFGFGYGVITFGSGRKNISLGLSYGYAGSNWADKPVVSVCFKLPAGKRGYIMAENYFLPIEDENVMVSLLGGRSLIRRVAFDYGLVIPVISGMENFFAIPWLGITVPFGGN